EGVPARPDEQAEVLTGDADLDGLVVDLGGGHLGLLAEGIEETLEELLDDPCLLGGVDFPGIAGVAHGLLASGRRGAARGLFVALGTRCGPVGPTFAVPPATAGSATGSRRGTWGSRRLVGGLVLRLGTLRRRGLTCLVAATTARAPAVAAVDLGTRTDRAHPRPDPRLATHATEEPRPGLLEDLELGVGLVDVQLVEGQLLGGLDGLRAGLYPLHDVRTSSSSCVGGRGSGRPHHLLRSSGA